MMYMRLDISGSVVISCIMILGGLCITRIKSRITTDTNMTAVSDMPRSNCGFLLGVPSR